MNECRIAEGERHEDTICLHMVNKLCWRLGQRLPNGEMPRDVSLTVAGDVL
jgi:hypothetical protein